MQFAFQVGSWLLTKETCAAVAVTVASKGFEAPFGLVEKVGMLLISTLTSLKHAGAAFSARDSLQEIATTCLSSKNSKNGLCLLPDLWVSRLLDEISSNPKSFRFKKGSFIGPYYEPQVGFGVHSATKSDDPYDPF